MPKRRGAESQGGTAKRRKVSRHGDAGDSHQAEAVEECSAVKDKDTESQALLMARKKVAKACAQLFPSCAKNVCSHRSVDGDVFSCIIDTGSSRVWIRLNYHYECWTTGEPTKNVLPVRSFACSSCTNGREALSICPHIRMALFDMGNKPDWVDAGNALRIKLDSMDREALERIIELHLIESVTCAGQLSSRLNGAWESQFLSEPSKQVASGMEQCNLKRFECTSLQSDERLETMEPTLQWLRGALVGDDVAERFELLFQCRTKECKDPIASRIRDRALFDVEKWIHLLDGVWMHGNHARALKLMLFAHALIATSPPRVSWEGTLETLEDCVKEWMWMFPYPEKDRKRYIEYLEAISTDIELPRSYDWRDFKARLQLFRDEPHSAHTITEFTHPQENTLRQVMENHGYVLDQYLVRNTTRLDGSDKAMTYLVCGEVEQAVMVCLRNRVMQSQMMLLMELCVEARPFWSLELMIRIMDYGLAGDVECYQIIYALQRIHDNVIAGGDVLKDTSAAIRAKKKEVGETPVRYIPSLHSLCTASIIEQRVVRRNVARHGDPPDTTETDRYAQFIDIPVAKLLPYYLSELLGGLPGQSVCCASPQMLKLGPKMTKRSVRRLCLALPLKDALEVLESFIGTENEIFCVHFVKNWVASSVNADPVLCWFGDVYMGLAGRQALSMGDRECAYWLVILETLCASITAGRDNSDENILPFSTLLMKFRRVCQPEHYPFLSVMFEDALMSVEISYRTAERLVPAAKALESISGQLQLWFTKLRTATPDALIPHQDGSSTFAGSHFQAALDCARKLSVREFDRVVESEATSFGVCYLRIYLHLDRGEYHEAAKLFQEECRGYRMSRWTMFVLILKELQRRSDDIPERHLVATVAKLIPIVKSASADSTNATRALSVMRKMKPRKLMARMALDLVKFDFDKCDSFLLRETQAESKATRLVQVGRLLKTIDKGDLAIKCLRAAVIANPTVKYFEELMSMAANNKEKSEFKEVIQRAIIEKLSIMTAWEKLEVLVRTGNTLKVAQEMNRRGITAAHLKLLVEHDEGKELKKWILPRIHQFISSDCFKEGRRTYGLMKPKGSSNSIETFQELMQLCKTRYGFKKAALSELENRYTLVHALCIIVTNLRASSKQYSMLIEQILKLRSQMSDTEIMEICTTIKVVHGGKQKLLKMIDEQVLAKMDAVGEDETG